eukprot:363517-Chlamydomonas_euryale.AAC.12
MGWPNSSSSPPVMPRISEKVRIAFTVFGAAFDNGLVSRRCRLKGTGIVLSETLTTQEQREHTALYPGSLGRPSPRAARHSLSVALSLWMAHAFACLSLSALLFLFLPFAFPVPFFFLAMCPFPALVPSSRFCTWRSMWWGISGLTLSDPFS